MTYSSRPNATFSQIRATPKSFFAIILSILVAVPTIAGPRPLPATKDKKAKEGALKGLPITELSEDEAILHALNRLAYGLRPGEVERIRELGLGKWIEQQLNPNSIDDRTLEARLDQFPTLRMSTAKLLAEYTRAKQQEKQAAAREARLEQRRAEPAASGHDAEEANDVVAAHADGAQSAQSSDDSSSPAAMKESQQETNAGTRGGVNRNALSGPDPNSVPRAIADDSKRPQRVIEELAMAKVTRGVYSERQLQQILDDFWFNHFNVFAGKGEDRWFLTSYERDVIQPRTLGKFKELLTATRRVQRCSFISIMHSAPIPAPRNGSRHSAPLDNIAVDHLAACPRLGSNSKERKTFVA